MKIMMVSLLFCCVAFASDITYLAKCKQNSYSGPRVVEVAKIGNALAASVQDPFGEYFYAEMGEAPMIKAEEKTFTFSVTNDAYTYIHIDFTTGKGRLLQRLIPTFHNCLSGGNPSDCLVFNEILHSCEVLDYSPGLFDN